MPPSPSPSPPYGLPHLRRALMARLINQARGDALGMALPRPSFGADTLRPAFLPSPMPRPVLHDSDSESGPLRPTTPGDMQRVVERHLPDPEELLRLPGGDTTRGLHTIKRPLRLNSVGLCTDVERERRGSLVLRINVPGGFRRQFMEQQAQRQNRQVSFVTNNFLEFLSVYGHFAGEELEDDDYLACSYYRDAADEEQPLVEGRRKRGTASTVKAYFLLLKAFVGTGVLFLPRAFYNGGMVFLAVSLAAFGLLSYWCYLQLVRARVATGMESFGDMGKVLYGPWFKVLILSLIVLLQMGFLAAYMVFTAENLTMWARRSLGAEWAKGAVVLVQLVMFVPLLMVRDITRLLVAAIVANGFILSGLAVIFSYCGAQLVQHGAAPVQLFNRDSFLLFIGVCIFAFEGIGLILPIRELMAEPHRFPGVLFAVIVTILVVFIASGCIGYAAYGADTALIIIFNLPLALRSVAAIQLLYSAAIFLLTPLAFFPAIRILEVYTFGRALGKHLQTTKWRKNGFRAAVVAVIALLAHVFGQNLDVFVLFVGCFACIPLVYMYPPLLHLRLCARSSLSRWSDYVLVVIGVVAMCYTTYQIVMT